jgi:hypothetical protein
MSKHKSSLLSLLVVTFGSSSLPFIESLPAQAVKFKPPSREAPRRTTGGGSRDEGQCFAKASSKTNSAIAPLIPSTQLGFTIEARPTIFVYIAKNSAREAFFSIQDENENHHYQMSVKLPNREGIIGIQLPADAPPLQVSKNYKWSLVTICGEALEPDNPEVTGWIHRVTIDDSIAKLNSSNSLKTAIDLAETGVWYDTLSMLAQLRKGNPDDLMLAAHWEELLASVGLGAIAQEPIVIVEDIDRQFSHAVKEIRKYAITDKKEY